jgi:hypothetical protein
MRKFILTAALLVALSSAKAQMSSEYIGKHSIEDLKVSFKYTKFSATDETIIINDTTYSIDWKMLDITIDGDVFPMSACASPSLKTNIIKFEGKTLILKYSNDWSRCIGYELK